MVTVDDGEPLSRAAPPVLILGSHRSGTSSIAGLFAKAAGLELGDVMPANRANAKGYFENVAIVRAHNLIMSSLDRDWTCPPIDLDPSDLQLEALREEIRLLDATGRPWGFKDPRLLFMLPAWAQLLPKVRFVGVIRDHEEVVRSLVARDGMDPGNADRITRAHVRRLRVLADRFEIPVVDFSDDQEAVLGRVRAIAEQGGLVWDEPAARAFFDPSMAKSRGHGRSHNDDIDVLRRTATGPAAWEVVDREALRAVLKELADEPDEFDRYCGPQANARRARLWRTVPREVEGVAELVRTDRIAASRDPSRGTVLVATDLSSVHRGLGSLDGRREAILLPDLTSYVSVGQLEAALRIVRSHLAPSGTVVLGLSQSDAEAARQRGCDPTTRDDVEAAADAAGYVVLGAHGDELQSVIELAPVETTGAVLEQLCGEIASLGERLAGPTLTSADATSPAASGGTAELVAERDAALAQLESLRRRYDRLAGRRSVRLATRIAAVARPLFRAVRRLRKTVQGG